jgi:hypothetical protein
VIDIDGGKAKEKRLDALLKSAHTLKIRVRLLDLDHNYIKDLSDCFVDGAVTIDANADVTRALDMTLFDPQGKIHIEPDSPHRTSIFIADMISVVYVVMTPDKSEVFHIPVFCGPIDKVDRDDMFISVKCLGKESLSLTNLWRGRTFKHGQTKTFVIERILRDMVGETKLSIPTKDSRIASDLKLNREKRPWEVAKNLARSMGYQLFYDGRGVAQMRKMNHNPAFVFRTDMVTTEPTMSWDLSKAINAVDVIGAKPKKSKRKVQYRAIADQSRPLSPWRLGRGGVPRYLWTEVQDDSLRTKAECKDIGDKLLKQGLLAGVDVKFDGIPHPRLQELDICRIDTEQVSATFPIKQFTIPLVAGDDATYGYLRRQRPRGGARAIKVKKSKKQDHKKVGAL